MSNPFAPSPTDQAHQNADTDSSPSADHHSLGGGPNQAAPGNHKHDKLYSPLNHNHDTAYSPLGHTHPLDVQTSQKVSAANTTVTDNVYVDINTLNTTVTVAGITDVLIVWLTLDLQLNAAGSFIGTIMIDGVQHPNSIIHAIVGRTHVARPWRITGLAAGDHVIKGIAAHSAVGPTSTIRTHSTLTIERVKNG